MKNLQQIKYLNTSFDEGKAQLESEGFKIPFAYENAALRIERGYEDDISTNGNWVKEGPLYLRGDNTRLLRIGLPYLHPKNATNAHKNSKEYINLVDKEVEKARAIGLEVKPEELNKEGNLTIPCKDIGSNKFGVFFFGGNGNDSNKSKRAQNYGDWLLNSPFQIQNITIYLDKKEYIEKVGNHANQFGLCRVGWVDWSDLGGYGGNLFCDDRVLGVRKKIGEATQKISYILPYTQRQIHNLYRLTNGVKEGKLPALKLEKIIRFLDKLKQ